MPTGTREQIGNEVFEQATYAPSVPFPTLAANVSGTNTFTLQGVQQGDIIGCSMIAPPAHIFLENAYVSAANTLTISWTTDGTGVTGATMAVVFLVTRTENGILGLSSLPTSVV